MIRIISQIKKEIVNVVGSAVAKWVLHYDGGLIVTRKDGARQIIKVFSEPAYRNVIKPAIHKATDVKLHEDDLQEAQLLKQERERYIQQMCRNVSAMNVTEI